MKNVHILPTDKPSKLHLWVDENGSKLALCEIEYSHTRNTQHIYITSDEKIKEEDWCISIINKLIFQATYTDVHNIYAKNPAYRIYGIKKIILTTDPDLIKDGVQAIDDEFLEWFVKNPSCEFVEVYKVGAKLFAEPIIPKEEPKQEIIASEEDAKIFVEAIKNPPAPNEELKQAFKNFSKQETLEEFVPYQEALDLKELGFDEPCFVYWVFDGIEVTFSTSHNKSGWSMIGFKNNQMVKKAGLCTTPTYSQAFRWFREKHDLHVNKTGNNYYTSFNMVEPKIEVLSFIRYTDTENHYEEAELACLRKLIEIVKNDKKD